MISVLSARLYRGLVARRLRALTMPEAVLVISIAAVAISGAVTVGSFYLASAHRTSVLTDLRLVVGAVGALSRGRPDYRFLGIPLVASDRNAAGAEVVIAAGALPERVAHTGADQLTFGRGLLPVSVAALGRAGCTQCEDLGLVDPSQVSFSLGTNEHPILDARLCQALLTFEHPALVYVSVRRVLDTTVYPGPHVPSFTNAAHHLAYSRVDRRPGAFAPPVFSLGAGGRAVGRIIAACTEAVDAGEGGASILLAFSGRL